LAACFAGLGSGLGAVMGRSFGSAACSVKAPVEPTGRRRTTPGFAMVAATIFASSVSLAKPWWKRLLLDPQAANAAFIDGAVTARSKKPAEVT
jgi:hypothetical protein